MAYSYIYTYAYTYIHTHMHIHTHIQVANMFLDEVVKKMIASFEKRCATLRLGENKATAATASRAPATARTTKVALT